MCLKAQAAAQQISQQFPDGIGELPDVVGTMLCWSCAVHRLMCLAGAFRWHREQCWHHGSFQHRAPEPVSPACCVHASVLLHWKQPTWVLVCAMYTISASFPGT